MNNLEVQPEIDNFMELGLDGDDDSSAIRRSKPLNVKFKEIFICDLTEGEITEDVINFIRDSAEQLAYMVSLVEDQSMLYRRFKNSRVRFDCFDFLVCFHAYHKRLIDEWLAYKRDLVSITSCAPRSYYDYEENIWKKAFVGYDVQFIEDRLAVITRSDGKTVTSVFRQGAVP
ncbi:unnamed protein product, partial [Mesorhabditis spiculigera]